METVPGRRILCSTRLIKALSKFPHLDRPTKLCYLLMCAYGRDSGECYAAATTLARDLCSTARQVQRYWSELRQHGWIASRREAGRVSHHVFPWHPALAAATTSTHDTHVVTPTTPMSPPHDTHVVPCIGSMDKDLRRRQAHSLLGVMPPRPAPQTQLEEPTTTSKISKEVRAHIWGYFQGQRPIPVDPPDRVIVQQCVAALQEHSIQDLELLLRDRFRRGYRPGTSQGPQNYTWFVAVIQNAFSPDT